MSTWAEYSVIDDNHAVGVVAVVTGRTLFTCPLSGGILVVSRRTEYGVISGFWTVVPNGTRRGVVD